VEGVFHRKCAKSRVLQMQYILFAGGYSVSQSCGFALTRCSVVEKKASFRPDEGAGSTLRTTNGDSARLFYPFGTISNRYDCCKNSSAVIIMTD